MSDDRNNGTWWKVLASFIGGAALAALVTYLLVRGRGGRSTEPTDTADELDKQTDDKIESDTEPTDDDLKTDLEDLA